MLINNAGVMLPDQRKLTKDGYEMHLGVNYFGKISSFEYQV